LRLYQALAYFVVEAGVSLVRSWRVSLLAVLTIAVSLFVGGAFLLVGDNLSRLVERWREEARIVVYLDSEADDAARDELSRRLADAPWVAAVEERTPEEAAARFRELFPGLAGLVEGWEDQPLPASLEIVFDPAAAGPGLEPWLAELRADPAVDVVDDDRDWVRQLETLVALVRGAGLALGAVLLGAAIFTIASVIRLTAYLYHEEIAVMRLVGATEFFIRGPFYTEGLLQGLLGGTLAVGALWGAYAAVVESAGDTLLGTVLLPDFLGWRALAALVALGGAAGLVGAVTSLRRESLGAETG
jgi:cell division transport system permease protein